MDNREITALLHAWNAGEPDALEKLLPLVMDDLRRTANHYLQDENRSHTRPTSLVNEVCLRLLGQGQPRWENRKQFFFIVGQLVRHILVDQARSRIAAKRGYGVPLVSLSGAANPSEYAEAEYPPEVLIDLDVRLTRLEKIAPRSCKVVELRFFGGFTVKEIAQALNISNSTVNRELRMVKRWLTSELGKESPDD